MSLNHFSFDTVDTALELVGKDYYQCKVDLSHAYRSVPIHPDDYQHCGSKWDFDQSGQPTYMMDTTVLRRLEKPRNFPKDNIFGGSYGSEAGFHLFRIFR